MLFSRPGFPSSRKAFPHFQIRHAVHQQACRTSTIGMKKASQALLPLIAPPESLSGSIISRVRTEVRKAAWRLAILTGAAALGAFSALAALVRILILDAGSSEIWQYLSVIFSDTGIAFSHWKEIAFSVIESLPVATVSLFLLSLFAFLFLLRLFTRAFARYSGGLKAA